MSYSDFLLGVGLYAAYAIIFLIIFAESGLFFGFFLPGDSLLFSLGLLCAQSHFNVYVLIVIAAIAAVTGDSVGYVFGRKVGPSLFKRENSRFFRKDYLQKAHDFYEKHGKITIVLARFTPFVRTFAPIVAGIGKMDYPTFLAYNFVGGTSWVIVMSMLGYFLGSLIPSIDTFILPIVALIVVVSLIPATSQLKLNVSLRGLVNRIIGIMIAALVFYILCVSIPGWKGYVLVDVCVSTAALLAVLIDKRELFRRK